MKTVIKMSNEDLGEEIDDKPAVISEMKIVPYSPTAEVAGAFDDFLKKVRDAAVVNSVDWPKGRTLELTLEFAVVPKSISAKFRHN